MKHTSSKSPDNKKKAGSAKSQVARKRSKNGQDQDQHENSKGENATLEKFFIDQLKDIYYAENKIAQSLPLMQSASTTDELKEAFEDHLLQTQRHIRRLERVFEMLGIPPEGKICEAIEGIVKEAETIMNETEEGTMTRDAALIMAAQKVEHYEIATYGGLLQFAITMGLPQIAEILEKTLIEEENTDALLTDIAEQYINLGAELEGNAYSWDQKAEIESVG